MSATTSNIIDASVGEAIIVKDALFKTISLKQSDISKIDFSYQLSAGHTDLVKYLEYKHQAPVVIGNGAKQLLGSCFYALKKLGKQTIGMRQPYWGLLPPLIEMHGLNWKPSYAGVDANLMLIPNNPDNFVSQPDIIKGFVNNCMERKVPIIHDAVYYNHIYLPADYDLTSFGDVQIFSASKSFGLSSIRIGYAVCHNVEFYKLIKEYVEHMTVGVSILSQSLFLEILQELNGKQEDFESLARGYLINNKKIVSGINSEVLEVPADIEKSNGIFLWCRKRPKANFLKSKVNVADGKPFGRDGFVRMNLGLPADIMQEIVNRLNHAI